MSRSGNALAYYYTATITSVKSFTVKAVGGARKGLYEAVNCNEFPYIRINNSD